MFANKQFKQIKNYERLVEMANQILNIEGFVDDIDHETTIYEAFYGLLDNWTISYVEDEYGMDEGGFLELLDNSDMDVQDDYITLIGRNGKKWVFEFEDDKFHLRFGP